MVTGEPVPVDVGPGDDVIGATISTDGALIVEATRVGADTALAQIIRLVDQAQGSRAEVQRLADRVAGIFVPLAIATAFVTLGTWLSLGSEAGRRDRRSRRADHRLPVCARPRHPSGSWSARGEGPSSV